MPKLMLGDNPFFAISHLSPGKSERYLEDKHRWENAASVIRSVRKLSIDSFMISSHSETEHLLNEAGYAGDDVALPDVCLVVPNVHEVNVRAAAAGLVGTVKCALFEGMCLSDLRPSRLFRRVVMGNLNYTHIKYIALHNVVVDLLIGLRAKMVLVAFCWLTELFGYRSVLITLNPMRLLEMGVKCHAICCYYNNRLYNVSDSPTPLLDTFDQNTRVREIWAMGVLASGVVSYKELSEDQTLRRFSRIIVASSKLSRIKEMRDALAK